MSDPRRALAPKALATSDVARPKVLGLAALGAAIGVTGVVAAEGTPLASARPIARPHAKVACASCHSDSSVPAIA